MFELESFSPFSCDFNLDIDEERETELFEVFIVYFKFSLAQHVLAFFMSQISTDVFLNFFSCIIFHTFNLSWYHIRIHIHSPLSLYLLSRQQHSPLLSQHHLPILMPSEYLLNYSCMYILLLLIFSLHQNQFKLLLITVF